MPNRIIRDGILLSERLNAVTPMAELHYRRLMSVVDDYGRTEAAAAVVRAAAWSMRDGITCEMVDGWQEELAAGDRPLIVIYWAGGKKYLEIQEFGQRIRTGRDGKPAPSKYPAQQSNDRDTRRHAADGGDTPRHAATRGHSRPVARSSESVVPSSESVGRGAQSGGSKAAAAPAPLTVQEWDQPDAEEIAQRLASELIPHHWFPSDIRLSVGALVRVLATAVDMDASARAIGDSHVLWRQRVEEARLSGSLPKGIANKPFAWWISDGLYLQEPRIGSTRLEQVAARGGASRTVARLMGGKV